MCKRVPVIVWIIFVLLWVTGCAAEQAQPAAESAESANMPNPASAYCEQQGGRLEMRSGADGTYGVCCFQDGTECEEWAYYRGECTPGRVGGDEVQIIDAVAAREAVLAYLRGLGTSLPAADSTWSEEDLATGLLGATHLRYASDGWTVDVSFPIVAPQATVYAVTVQRAADDIVWQGEVNAAGEVSELHEPPDAGLANPASVYCTEQGGRVEMRTDANGVQGVCVFDDGTECDEWAYWRGECGPAVSD